MKPGNRLGGANQQNGTPILADKRLGNAYKKHLFLIQWKRFFF